MNNPKPQSDLATPRPRSLSREDFHRIRPKLWKALCQLGAEADELEDLTQQTFLNAHDALSAFEWRSSLDTWVVGIGKGVWLHHKRRLRALKRVAEEVSLDQEDVEEAASRAALETPRPTPEALAAGREDLSQVEAAIRDLPLTHGQPLLLQVAGHTYEQIGNLLGISPDLATSRIFQARDKLRRKFPGRLRQGSL